MDTHIDYDDAEEGAIHDDDNTQSHDYPSTQWPRSFRNSMDRYRTIESPEMSISVLPGLQRLRSYSFTSSFGRRKVSPDIVTEDLNKPLIEANEIEPNIYVETKKVVQAEEQRRKCSPTQAIINGINVLCGVGILSTPYALKEGGWLSLIVLLSIAVVAWATGILLRDCIESKEGLETYPDIGQTAFGTLGRIFISILLYTELYAICVEFLILEGDNLAALFPHTTFGYNNTPIESRDAFIIIIGILLLPTVWLRDLSMLSYISVFGVISSVIVMISVFWIGVIDGVGFHHSGQLVNTSKLPITIGLYGFCYSGHSVFPNIYTSLKDRSRYPIVLMASIVICTTMYVCVASMGLTMFGDATTSQITLNLPQEYLASKVAVWTTVVNPFTNLEELLPSATPSSVGENMKNCGYCIAIRTALVFSTICVAIYVPFFAYVMALIGSFLSMLVCIILPAVCFLKIVGAKATLMQKILCIFIIGVGIACAIAGTYASLDGIAKSISA